MSRRALLIAALLLPLVGFLTAIAVGEMRYRNAREIVVGISGYDPSDMVRGHYLQYRLTTETPLDDSGEPERACARTIAGRSVVHNFTGARPHDCSVDLPIEFVRNAHRLYVQQEHAPALEEALAAGRASVGLAEVSPGSWVGRRLLVDGVHWTDARPTDD